MRERKLRAWMKKEFNLLKASYDTFTIHELAIGRCEYKKYENWEDYTGLKDKNGKEIYEGDILEDERKQKGHVFYHRNSFQIEWNLRCFDGKKEVDESFEYGKVIGNIYENPELINP